MCMYIYCVYTINVFMEKYNTEKHPKYKYNQTLDLQLNINFLDRILHIVFYQIMSK